jgi:hypothetical protein
MPNWKALGNREVAQEGAAAEQATDIEHDLRQLLLAYRAGNVLALFEASELCFRHQTLLPGWIPLAALNLVAEALNKGLSLDVGRAASLLARHQEDLKHLKRWETVRDLIADRESYNEHQRLLRSSGLTAAMRKKTKTQAPIDPGKNLQETFVAASRALQGTKAFGAPDTIRNSYKLIQRVLKNPSVAPAFMRVSPRVYQRFEKFGLDSLTKIIPPSRKARGKN